MVPHWSEDNELVSVVYE